MSTLTNIQILRSAVPHKRPDPAQLLDGQLAINYKDTDPGLFTLLQNGDLVKFGPVSVTDNGKYPNQEPSPDGVPGNSKGEEWLDERPTYYSPILKIFNGTEWVTANGFTIDDDASGNLSFLKRLTVTELVADRVWINESLDLDGNFLPAGTNCEHTIGSASNRWKEIWSCMMNTTGNLTVGGDTDLSGFLQVGGYLSVDGDTDLRGSVNFTQNCASGDDFKCGMPASFDCDTTVTGKLTGTNAEFSSDVTARGNVNIGDGCAKKLTVNAETTFKCQVNFQTYPLDILSAVIGDLTVTGNTVIGDDCFNDKLTVEADSTFKCKTKHEAELRTKSDFVSDGLAYFNDTVRGKDLNLDLKATSKSTVSSDPGQTLTTKDYMENYVNTYVTEWTQSGVTVHTTVPNLHVNPNYGTGTLGTILDPWKEIHVGDVYPNDSLTGVVGTPAKPWYSAFVHNYGGKTMRLDNKAYSESTINSDSGDTLVTKDYVDQIQPKNGAINFNAGNGLSETGTNATADQSSATTKTFSVRAKNNTIGVDANGIFVQTGNLGINNAAINFNAGNGLTSTGSNATANQSTASTKTFTVQASNNTINVASGGISVATGNVDTVSKISCVNTDGTASNPAIRTTRTGRDAGTEEVKIVGGTGITVTRNNATQLTIVNSSPGSGLWQTNSGALRPSTAGQAVKPNGTATLGLSGARWSTVYATTTNTTNLSGCTANGNIIPNTSAAHDLGSSSNRWKNLYTSDLHLSNEHLGGNDIDGSWGDWTIKEGENELYVVNNRSGQRFKMALIPF